MKGYFFIGARTGAGEKIPGAGQKWTGSATLALAKIGAKTRAVDSHGSAFIFLSGSGSAFNMCIRIWIQEENFSVKTEKMQGNC